MNQTDVIDAILGDEYSERVLALRAQKPELGTQMQTYYDALFRPSEGSSMAFPLADRLLIAIRTASHTGSTSVVDWYSACAARSGVASGYIQAAKNVDSVWPSGDRLFAAMRHVDLITSRPAESTKADIDALLADGLTPQGIVVLSQVVAYVSYQLRLIAVLRALGASS
ncbi:MAG: hypothetical protein E6R14_08125 [Thermomicrobiales bacterium]|nr:MAG: hypothetical protein E6R14_08125 [Thermomicrobiales bacterium]